MDVEVGTTYDDGLVERTVVDVTGKHVHIIARWRGADEAGHSIRWKRDAWNEWFKGRRFTKRKR